MRKQPTELSRHINEVVKRYFRGQGLSYKEVADRLGYTSEQGVQNQLSTGVFGKRVAEKYAREFGFNVRFLLEGKGELIDNRSGYRKLKDENTALKAIVRSQRIIIQKYEEEKRALQEQLAS